MILSFGNYIPLRSPISSRNQSQIRIFLILWNRLEVLFHNLPCSRFFIINSSSYLIKFEEIIINFLNSPWIRPLFTIIPLNSRYFHQIGKFGLCFDMRPYEIDELAVSSRQMAPLPWNEGKFFINLVNFDLVNTRFSLNFLKFKQFNRILSDSR